MLILCLAECNFYSSFNLVIGPIVREHLFAILSICLIQFKCEINVKPRMLNRLNLSIFTPSIVNWLRN